MMEGPEEERGEEEDGVGGEEVDDVVGLEARVEV
jgi:hypothetical protein